MTSNDGLPSYEESNSQYNALLPDILTKSSTQTRGPDEVCIGRGALIADFIPWIEFHGLEDMGYLLLRVNSWLYENPSYEVEKCEMIPRMINSKGKLEVSNCYIFNMSCGRKCFVYQLRIYLTINKEKVVADQVCLKTIIPDVIQERSRHIYDLESVKALLILRSSSPKFHDMSEVIIKLNKDLQNAEITGKIINISTFYMNVLHYFMNPSSTLHDELSFYEESGQGKCHLKCLSVFYKPGNRINGNVGFRTFQSLKEPLETLDDLTNTALKWIYSAKNNNYISMEIFQEYSAKNECEANQICRNMNSTFIFSDKGSTMVRKEVINLFYFSGIEFEEKKLQLNNDGTEIIWITPRKYKLIYETYDSFMEYLKFIFITYEDYILDVETNLCLNPLTWSTIRCQTVERIYNESSANYQIYTVRLIVKTNTVKLPCKGEPLPSVSPTKYARGCNIC